MLVLSRRRRRSRRHGNQQQAGTPATPLLRQDYSTAIRSFGEEVAILNHRAATRFGASARGGADLKPNSQPSRAHVARLCLFPPRHSASSTCRWPKREIPSRRAPAARFSRKSPNRAKKTSESDCRFRRSAHGHPGPTRSVGHPLRSSPRLTRAREPLKFQFKLPQGKEALTHAHGHGSPPHPSPPSACVASHAEPISSETAAAAREATEKFFETRARPPPPRQIEPSRFHRRPARRLLPPPTSQIRPPIILPGIPSSPETPQRTTRTQNPAKSSRPPRADRQRERLWRPPPLPSPR